MSAASLKVRKILDTTELTRMRDIPKRHAIWYALGISYHALREMIDAHIHLRVDLETQISEFRNKEKTETRLPTRLKT